MGNPLGRDELKPSRELAALRRTEERLSRLTQRRIEAERQEEEDRRLRQASDSNGLSSWYDKLRNHPSSLSSSVRSSISSSRTTSECEATPRDEILVQPEIITSEDDIYTEPEEIVLALAGWVRKMRDPNKDPFHDFHGLVPSPINPRRAVRLDPYHGFKWEGPEDSQEGFSWSGGRDSKGRLLGKGVVSFPDGSELGGTWKEGQRHGKCSLACPRLGIDQLVGEYRNNRLTGVGKLVRASEEVVEGEFRDGCLHGLVRVLDPDKNVSWVGRYEGGVPTGVSWQFREGGGCVTGRVDDQGNLTGSDVVFVYPDWTTCYVGEFLAGIPVKVRSTTLHSVTFVRGLAVLKVNPPTEPELYRELSTKEKICTNLTQTDPYESRMIRVGPSKIGEGDGVFARVSAPPGTVMAFYNGVRIPPEVTDDGDDWEDCSYRIFIRPEGDDMEAGGRMDIPKKYRDVNSYSATLAHKVNHSFHSTCEFAEFWHPLYGLLPCITTCTQVSEGDELTCYYRYMLCDCPDWYATLWELQGQVHTAEE